MNKSMMLVTSTWGKGKTFKMIPTSNDCPYNECIFDAENKVLAVISKEKKESLHMLAKLNEFGDPQTLKIGRRTNGKDYAEERKTLETFYEYYIETPEEVIEFVNLFATNADKFDFNTYMTAEVKAPVTSSIITQ
jgi:hypothetical protein